MALPIVKSAIDCSDFTNTVLPYIHQLKPLPSLIFESISNPAALQQIYLDTNPLITAFALALFLSPIFLVVSEINKNYSQVDRCWSILPTVYNAHYALYARLVGLPTKRLDTVLTASAIWSCRLTFNYWRKGGYSIGSEDYRWEILRKYISPPLFFVFNVVFISLAQSILLFLITTPTYILLLIQRISAEEVTSTSPIRTWAIDDVITSYAMVACVLVSMVADQQQWNFQNAKKYYLEKARVPGGYEQAELDRGFVTSGLWAWSRHPNFAAEQTFWVLLYQWSCFLTGSFVNWSGIGALSYLALFQSSTWFTELVSRGKYPEYKEYQAKVGKFLPRISADEPNWGAPQKGRAEGVGKEIDKEKTKARERYNLR